MSKRFRMVELKTDVGNGYENVAPESAQPGCTDIQVRPGEVAVGVAVFQRKTFPDSSVQQCGHTRFARLCELFAS